MSIRRARSEDAEAIARVLAEVAEEGWIATEPPVDIKERAGRFRETIETDGPGAFWVLESDGEIVGSVGVFDVGVPGVMGLGMTILEGFRGMGGGRALLETAVAHVRSVGAHKLELEVWPDNARAIALYASSGFEVEGIRQDHYRRRDGTLRSSMVMALRLSSVA